MFPNDPLSLLLPLLGALLLIRALLSCKSLLYFVGRWWSWLDDRTQAYQCFHIPRHTDAGLENPLYRAAAAYVASLPSSESAPASSVFSSGRMPNDFSLLPVPGLPAADSFLGCRLSWSVGPDRLVLRLRRQDRVRVLRPYLQHVESAAEDPELRRREQKFFVLSDGGGEEPGWRVAAPFAHPATLDAVAMDPEVKARVRADLEAFLKGRTYYHRLCRPWRRSYLLHGPPGTGKSTFAAAMANFLCYDVYDLDLASVSGGGNDLKDLLLATSARSVILVEDLDRYLRGEGGESRLAGMLSFMDGIFSCCGEERVMVYTMRGAEGVDAAVLRPGRVDVNVHFPMCDFPAFKTLASSYLGLKDHKLYPQVEEGFQSGARISPAEVGEIMMTNRSSPSRALKSVISALQHSSLPPPQRLGLQFDGKSSAGGCSSSASCSGAVGPEKDSAAVRELKRLFGLIKMRSRKNGVMPVEVAAAAAAAGTTLDKLAPIDDF